MKNTKYAVITGGSKGLGFAFAKHLALQCNYSVILIARSKDDLVSAVNDIENKGGRAHYFAADISNIEGMQLIAESIKERFRKVDFLINNACTLHVNTLSDYKIQDIKRDVDVGLFGAMLFTKLFIPMLNTEGKILFISSGFGLIGVAGYSVYSAIKAGIINFAASIKREFYGKKISIYVAVPSDIDTPGLKNEIDNMPNWMNVSKARGKVMSADVAAQKILKKCNGKRFLIFSDYMVSALHILDRILPRYFRDKIIDSIFPKP